MCSRCMAIWKAKRARALLAEKFAPAPPPPPPPGDSIPETLFDDDDADIAATILGSFSHIIGAGKWSDIRNKPLTPEERKRIADAVLWQQQQGLALLSDSARARLLPVLKNLNGYLDQFLAGGYNAIEVGRELSDLFNTHWVEGPLRVLYTDYEFSRLARTEIAFAYTAGVRNELQAEGVSWAAMDAVGVSDPPHHPNCQCELGTIMGEDGIEYAVSDITPRACEFCIAISEATYSAVDNLDNWRDDMTDAGAENIDHWLERH